MPCLSKGWVDLRMSSLSVGVECGMGTYFAYLCRADFGRRDREIPISLESFLWQGVYGISDN